MTFGRWCLRVVAAIGIGGVPSFVFACYLIAGSADESATRASFVTIGVDVAIACQFGSLFDCMCAQVFMRLLANLSTKHNVANLFASCLFLMPPVALYLVVVVSGMFRMLCVLCDLPLVR